MRPALVLVRCRSGTSLEKWHTSLGALASEAARSVCFVTDYPSSDRAHSEPAGSGEGDLDRSVPRHSRATVLPAL